MGQSAIRQEGSIHAGIDLDGFLNVLVLYGIPA